MPEFIEFSYEVKATVTFTRKEYEFLIEAAKTHYDSTCKAAGLAIGEQGARENGFIAQLRLFPTDKGFTKVTWPFRNFDICMKILEPATATIRAQLHVIKTRSSASTKGSGSGPRNSASKALLEAQLELAVSLTNDMWLITTRMNAEGKRLREEAQRAHNQEPDGVPDQLWRLHAG